METINCAHCGKEKQTVYSGRTKFCSDICRSRSRHAKLKVNLVVTCVGCGIVVPAKRRRKKYCSNACKCRTQLTPKKREQYVEQRRLKWHSDAGLRLRAAAWKKTNQAATSAKRRLRYHSDHEFRLRILSYHRNRKVKIAARLRERRVIDPEFHILCNIRSRIRNALRGVGAKSARTVELLGCPVAYFKAHIERQFKRGMTWKNYGRWHIDHIVPVVVFDLTTTDGQRRAFHWTNQQPLWKEANYSKHDKVIQTENFIELFEVAEKS